MAMRSASHGIPIIVASLSLAGLAACDDKVPIKTQGQPEDGAASTAEEVGGTDAPIGFEDGQATGFGGALVGPPDGMQGSGGLALGGASGTGGAGSGGVAGGGFDARRLDVGPADGPSGGASGGAIGSGGASGGVIGGGGIVSLGGASGLDGAIGTGGSTSPVVGPCDIYAAANPPTPCAAAYSMVRVLSSTYSGPLYQVRSGGSSKNTGTGGTTKDIGAVDGFADGASQDDFCGSSGCTVSILYDQSGNGNNLTVAKKGCYTGTASEDDYESSATKRSLTISGHKVYALYMNAHEGYRNNQTRRMPTGTDPQGIYELADGEHAGDACCWDFGNASIDNCYGGSTLNALSFGFGYWGTGGARGPWFMGDSTNGAWPTNTGTSCSDTLGCNMLDMPFEYAFGTLGTQTGKGSIRVGDARGGNLSTEYDGQVPGTWSMKGGIILGIGEDNFNSSYGTFYEGAITAGRPSSATEDAVFKNVKDAGYGK
jgi:non-reducing end alpha-L-arabinofuranosidase